MDKKEKATEEVKPSDSEVLEVIETPPLDVNQLKKELVEEIKQDIQKSTEEFNKKIDNLAEAFNKRQVLIRPVVQQDQTPEIEKAHYATDRVFNAIFKGCDFTLSNFKKVNTK